MIASFEFTNLQCLNSTFMNFKIPSLVFNAEAIKSCLCSVHVSDCIVINKIYFSLLLIFICLIEKTNL